MKSSESDCESKADEKLKQNWYSIRSSYGPRRYLKGYMVLAVDNQLCVGTHRIFQ
jgi:hypothetical protein